MKNMSIENLEFCFYVHKMTRLFTYIFILEGSQLELKVKSSIFETMDQ